ncbi:GIY-YIG nuclease family protein [Bacillus wiedmannii]|uniref:GIY-YIG nuclease family protein n=1 Tax=Bacillus wiedmannii TaxID=1890302 RepID=UPI00285334F2|nr:GIY-YIG nuclease family protein [Bacillus wiedmannii]MDR4943376.1 GIY-YIG nuclease family protein [Bacillus wiedmannii]
MISVAAKLSSFEIIKKKRKDFEQGSMKDFEIDRVPVVYIQRDEKNLYVGKSIDIYERFVAHLSDESKTFNEVIVIKSELFNESSIKHIETLLIEYLSKDNKFNLLNKVRGQKIHRYKGREKIDSMFKEIWNQLIEEELASESLFRLNSSNPRGEDGLSDQVASNDLLGRERLVNELSNFYTEYNEGNSSPLYMGIFSRWGMGKSSFIEMLTKNIEANVSETNKYLVCKVDCSLFHRKEKLWITILNKLLDEISTMKKKKNSKKQEKVFNFNFFSFKTKFFLNNLLSWLKRRWKLIALLFLSLIGINYLITKSFPNAPIIPKDYKETTALITVITLVFTLIKTRTLIFKQNVFLQDDRNEESSFIRSTKEYEQLISLINKVKKKKNLKILLVLDEMDRMHKDLLPDIIELIQLFKGLNNKQFIKKSNAENDNSDESVISFIFSFNQDMMFPVIGRSVSLGDNQLFINSYKNYEGYVEGQGKDAYLNFYKLGKEYMDKYLDLTVYLEEEIDYTKLMEELFKEDRVIGDNKSEKLLSDNDEGEMLEQANGEVGSAQQSAQHSSLNSNRQKSPSFTELEIKVIRETVRKYASKVEPRKVKRLKNALILLKKLNKEIDSKALENVYEEELRGFILNFLEIENSKQQISDSAYNEIATTAENSIEDKSSNSRVNMTRQLKYTEYFIHDKILS